MNQSDKTKHLLSLIRSGEPMTLGQRLRLVVYLSVPAIIAQLSSIVMQYIDASMVGSLGAEASASIGLVSTTTWLFGGLCSAASTGFTVQVAHRIGAGDMQGARAVLRQSFTAIVIWGLAVSVLGMSISTYLPYWLGGDVAIRHDASLYFFIFSLFLPALQLSFLASGMLRCSGNMHVASLLGVSMCMLDVLLNFFLIFPTRYLSVGGYDVPIFGAGLGVGGAALGTVVAESLVAAVMLWYLWYRSPELSLAKNKGCYRPICAIAANSFAITAESLCYMPGYGIADAATTLVGQSFGAGRRDLTRSFAYITVFMGMAVMSVMGGLMYAFAPQIIGIMTPVDEIRQLGTMALRIEAFAEPMFAASIVAYGVFVGAASTLIPCLMNFFSIWAVRLSLAALLAPSFGLKGVWIAMCVELSFRGVIFLIRLFRQRWLKVIPLRSDGQTERQ